MSLKRVGKLLRLSSKKFQKFSICALVIFAKMSQHLSVIKLCIFVFLSKAADIIGESIPSNIVS